MAMISFDTHDTQLNQENHHNTWKDTNVGFISLFKVGLSLIQSINSKEATIQSNNLK